MSEAPLHLRAGARAIDIAFSLLPLLLFFPVLLPMLYGGSGEESIIAQAAIVSAIPLLILFYYIVLFVRALRGQESFGCKLMGLHTEYPAGRNLAARYLLLGALPLLAIYLLGLLPLLLFPLLLPLLRSDLRSPFDNWAGITVCRGN